jgi:hypothetical protein
MRRGFLTKAQSETRDAVDRQDAQRQKLEGAFFPEWSRSLPVVNRSPDGYWHEHLGVVANRGGRSVHCEHDNVPLPANDLHCSGRTRGEGGRSGRVRDFSSMECDTSALTPDPSPAFRLCPVEHRFAGEGSLSLNLSTRKPWTTPRTTRRLNIPLPRAAEPGRTPTADCATAALRIGGRSFRRTADVFRPSSSRLLVRLCA